MYVCISFTFPRESRSHLLSSRGITAVPGIRWVPLIFIPIQLSDREVIRYDVISQSHAFALPKNRTELESKSDRSCNRCLSGSERPVRAPGL